MVLGACSWLRCSAGRYDSALFFLMGDTRIRDHNVSSEAAAATMGKKQANSQVYLDGLVFENLLMLGL